MSEGFPARSAKRAARVSLRLRASRDEPFLMVSVNRLVGSRGFGRSISLWFAFIREVINPQRAVLGVVMRVECVGKGKARKP